MKSNLNCIQKLAHICTVLTIEQGTAQIFSKCSEIFPRCMKLQMALRKKSKKEYIILLDMCTKIFGGFSADKNFYYCFKNISHVSRNINTTTKIQENLY